MKSGSLFTGTAALDMAAAEIFGTEMAWCADLDPGATTLLTHHYPDVPNLGDITATDWDLVAKLAPIDILTAGWPCQPWSLAGLQLGADDDRALWPYVGGCIRALRPRWVLLENVPAVVAAGELARVATSLATHGYRFAWVCLPASAVGAPHRRERFFLVAVADTEDERHERSRAARRRRARPTNGGDAASDAARRGLRAHQREDAAGQPDARRRAATNTDDVERVRQPVQQSGEAAAAGHRGRPDWAGYATAVHRWERVLGRPAPAPTVVGARGGRVLNPALPEWMMGLPDGWITAVPGLSRSAQLKLAGNGVVPRQAVAAYRYLLDVLERDEEVAA